MTLVLGGVRSGKSRYAQALAEPFARVTFVATARFDAGDPEMAAKIGQHRVDRPGHWHTVEEPLELSRVVSAADGDGCLVIDCLTLFAANLLEACGDDRAALDSRVAGLCDALRMAAVPVVLVSNEVGSGVVPAYESGRRFRDLVGELNQRVAAVAETVVSLVAGLPIVLKGGLLPGAESQGPQKENDAKGEGSIDPARFVPGGRQGCLVAGSASGVGKTTVALAIAAGLRRRGVRVQPFKGGPDFLDTGHLTRIAGRTARNVDTWMLSHKANVNAVRAAAADAEFVLVEGMMGLFDGKSGETDAGSSAEIARLLRLPVVLVVDAGKSARSLAAVVLGFEMFDAATPLAGVILNRVAGRRHYDMLAAAIGGRCRTPILGWLPREPAMAIPERHLGLRTAEESGGDPAGEIDRLAALAEQHLELDAIAKLACGLPFGPPLDAPAEEARPERGSRVRIGVARDEAFSFYYEDNLDCLRRAGAELVEFSPLHDTRLPDELDALYLGGGYPELYAAKLAANSGMLDGLRAFAASGRPVYAECGGMMVLGESLAVGEADRLCEPAHAMEPHERGTPDCGGMDFAMAGVLPLRFRMTAKLVQFGYVTVEFLEDCLLGAKGTAVRGHSFHYSKLADAGDAATAYRVKYSLSGREEREGFTRGNVLASYVHLHFGAEPGMARSFVAAARVAKEQRLVLAER